MKNNLRYKLRHGGGWLARVSTCLVVSCAMSLALVPASAFGAVSDDGTVYYTLPSADEAVSFEHTATDADGNEYTYEYLSVAISSPGYTESTYYLLGVNDTTATKDLPSSATDGTVSVAKVGLYGTSANQNPDEYLWNFCCMLNGATLTSDCYTNSSGTIPSVTVNGAEFSNMPRAVYMECNLLNTSASTTSGGYTYAFWVELENMREDRPKTERYDPAFATWSTGTGGMYALTSSLYTIAAICDGLIEESVDDNGNYTLATRYADGPETYKVVQNYEDISKGSQYYLLSKFADGTLEKATAAVICGYDDETGNYACRILNTGNDSDPDTNKYGGRLSNSVAQICDDICDLGLETAQEVYDASSETDFVKWYTPEQILTNADAVLISDGTGSYLAKDSTGDTNVVYSGLSTTENIAPLVNKQTELADAGQDYADICYKWPDHVFNCYYAQGCENVLLGVVSACFLSPEVFDITDTMAWWAKNVWHVTDSSLQDIVDSTCNDISMSRNETQLGTISADYEDTIAEMLNEGNAYYINNTEEIDALNGGNIATYDLEALKARTTGWETEDSTSGTDDSGSTDADDTGTDTDTGDADDTDSTDTSDDTALYDAGYEAGYAAGVASVSTDDAYNTGYAAGVASVSTDDAYSSGYAAGVADGIASVSTDDAYNEGYAAGYEAALAAAAESQTDADTSATDDTAAQATDDSSSSSSSAVKAGTTKTLGSGSTKAKYKVTSVSKKTVTYVKYKGAKKAATVPATVKIGGKKYTVTKVAAKAFKGTKAKTLTVKATKLTKAGVKNALKGSKVTTVKVPKAKLAKYKKYFAKANSGKKVTVKKA